MDSTRERRVIRAPTGRERLKNSWETPSRVRGHDAVRVTKTGSDLRTSRDSEVSFLPGVGPESAKALKDIPDDKKELTLPNIDKVAQVFGLFLLLGKEEFKKKYRELTGTHGANPETVANMIDAWLEEHGFASPEPAAVAAA